MGGEKSGVQNFSAVATENGKTEDSRELKEEKGFALQCGKHRTIEIFHTQEYPSM